MWSWLVWVTFTAESFQFSLVTQSCPTLCDSMDCSTPGFPVHQQLLELAEIHVHRVGDAIQPSVIPFSSCLQSFPDQGLFQWVSTSHHVARVASAPVLPMNIQDWFPLGLTGLISLQSKGLSRVFSSTTVQKHLAQKRKSTESFRLPVFLCFSYQSFQF